jgi:nonsense-mediated mRNA decay protein 3
MSTCLRKIPGLSKVKLIDAIWIWTEPHSMRLHIKLTIQKEVMNGAVLQQAGNHQRRLQTLMTPLLLHLT